VTGISVSPSGFVLEAAGPTLDNLCRRAAAQVPDRVALHADGTELTYAQLEDRVERCARAIAALVDTPGAVVGVAAQFGIAFAETFYGVVRGGHVAAVVNPLLRADGLERVLRQSSAVAVVVPPSLIERISEIRDRLPALRHVIVTAGPAAPGVIALNSLVAADQPPPQRRPVDPDSVAVIQFTSGTTGEPKAVQLTHRNLTVNAAQTAYAHGLDAGSVLLNYLPTFHPMHLNIATAAAAKMVLCTATEVADSIDQARRHGVTHYYSLPMRLAKLAADPQLETLRVPTLQAMLSGGSALLPALSNVLSTHFRVPVGQGYGLAETSPSTHFERLDRPKAGSCGVPVPDTECRIVDVATRAVRPVGELGEIQVRGPQLMHGYLGADTPGTDADGWFSTGDVGYVDEDGYLFLVDRIKDVFKCDNFLVAPTAIERIVLEHPEVTECVVVDRPDPVHGAVACALIVPAHPGVQADDIVAHVNDKLPYYEHLHSVILLERIPRSVNGKISRRDLRSLLTSGPSSQHPERTNGMVTFINRLTVTGSVEEFEELLDGITEYMTAQPGFQSRRLYRSSRNPQVFVEVAEWSDAAAHSAAMRNPAFGERVGKLRALATAEPDMFATVDEKVSA